MPQDSHLAASNKPTLLFVPQRGVPEIQDVPAASKRPTEKIKKVSEEVVRTPIQLLLENIHKYAELSRQDLQEWTLSETEQGETRIELGEKTFTLGNDLASGSYVFTKEVVDQDGNTFVIKFLNSDDKKSQHGFKREMGMLQQLNHKNIASIKETGKVSSEGREYLFYVLPKYEQTWDQFGRSDRLDSPEKILDFAEKQLVPILDALQAMHEAGIIHRDIKPENIMIDKEGNPVIIDMGIGFALKAFLAQYKYDETYDAIKVVRNEEGKKVRIPFRDLYINGTPDFLDPSYLKGHRLPGTTMSDIFSLGASVFQMLTGRVAAPIDDSAADFVSRLFEWAEDYRYVSKKGKRSFSYQQTRKRMRELLDQNEVPHNLREEIMRWLLPSAVNIDRFEKQDGKEIARLRYRVNPGENYSKSLKTAIEADKK